MTVKSSLNVIGNPAASASCRLYREWMRKRQESGEGGPSERMEDKA